MRPLLPVVLPVVALALLLSGCTAAGGGDAPRAAEASASPAVPASERLLAEDAAEDAEDAQAEPLASAEGELPLLGTATSPVRVEVLEVRAGADTTLLRWRLASATSAEVETYTSALSRPIGFDTRQIALLETGSRLQPFTFVPGDEPEGTDVGCVCSTLPERVGPEGRTLVALYPPLDAATAEVDVVLPGVVELTGVPVTR